MPDASTEEAFRRILGVPRKIIAGQADDGPKMLRGPKDRPLDAPTTGWRRIDFRDTLPRFPKRRLNGKVGG